MISRMTKALSDLAQKWASLLAGEDARWRQALRNEGAAGPDVDDPVRSPDASGCATKPEKPSLLGEAAKRTEESRYTGGRK